MLTGFIIGVSALIQLTTVFVALSLIRVTGWAKAWVLISMAIFLMEARRVFSFFEVIYDPTYQPRLYFEFIGLVTSLLMLTGVMLISPLFKTIKRAEETSKKSEKQLRDITSSLGEGIYVLDEQGRNTFMNPMAEHLLGWTKDELNEEGTHSLIHYRKGDGTPLPFEECGIHNVIKTGKPFVSRDEVFVRKDGAVFPVSAISTPIIENGKVVASVTAFRDISERKRIEEERENLIKGLREAFANVKTLRGLLPICSSCKKIRDDHGYWKQVETYVKEHTDADFTHSVCPECIKKMYPEHYKSILGQENE